MKKKEYLTVAINAPFITNFDYVPNSFKFKADDGTEVTIHKYRTQSSRSNADIFITVDPNEGLCESDVVLPRFTKGDMQLFLESRLNGDATFYPIPSINLTDMEIVHRFIDTHEFVIKPRNGARGLGSFYFKDDKVTLSKLLVDLKGNKYEELVQGGVIKPLACTEYFEGESNSFISYQEMIVQPVVHKTMEFRVLTDYDGMPFYTQKRELRGDVIQTATGSNGVKGGYVKVTDDYAFESVLKDSGVSPKLIENINLAFSKLKLGFNSFDLFFTDDGRWGFFEFSNQWGVTGIDPKIVIDHLINFFKGVYKEKIDKVVRDVPTLG